MKCLLRALWTFLGGIRFAIILISLAGIGVALGTVLEARADSHAFAAQWIYSSWVFSLLLSGFFVNILVSALRRWPFRWHHVPFLITHLGLLMVLAGVITKQLFGLQATLVVTEGAATQTAFVRDSQSLEVHYRPEGGKDVISEWNIPSGLSQLVAISGEAPPELRIKKLRQATHSRERLEFWIKGSHTYVEGLSPIPVQDWEGHPHTDAVAVSLGQDPVETWSFSAWRCDEDVETVMTALYTQDCMLVCEDALTGARLAKTPLRQALRAGVAVGDSSAAVGLIMGEGGRTPLLKLEITEATLPLQHTKIALNGAAALLNRTEHFEASDAPLMWKLERTTPAVAFIEDSYGDQYVCAMDAHGFFGAEAFPQHGFESLWELDGGYGGYAVETQVLPPHVARSLEDRQKAYDTVLEELIHSSTQGSVTVIAPLKLLHHACEETGSDFGAATAELLSVWRRSGGWLVPKQAPLSVSLEQTLARIDWTAVPTGTWRACQWTAELTPLVQQQLRHRATSGARWPLLEMLGVYLQDGSSSIEALNTLVAALFEVGAELPLPPPRDATAVASAQWLSAYLRAYDIDPHAVEPTLDDEQLWALLANDASTSQRPTLRSPVTHHHLSLTPLDKVEDNLPLVLLKIQDARGSENIPLTYDRFSSGPRWTALGGRYLVRFQPKHLELPYRVRLHDARQINQPNSQQAQAFEADVSVTDTRTAHTHEVTLSMNHVYETWDGYRFYLANIAPPTETDVRQVQLVVNRDPLKYWLTYPGALVLCIGIVLLFVIRPYKQRRGPNDGRKQRGNL